MNQEKYYICEMCEREEYGQPIIRKVDSPFNPNTHGKVCRICPSCSPQTKEMNETPERDKGGVWQPYWAR